MNNELIVRFTGTLNGTLVTYYLTRKGKSFTTNPDYATVFDNVTQAKDAINEVMDYCNHFRHSNFTIEETNSNS